MTSLRTRLAPLLPVSALTLLASSLAGANPTDFYCRAATGHPQAVYIADRDAGICEEQVNCTYVSSDVRERVEADFAQSHPQARGTALKNIPQAELTPLLNSYGFTLTWFPAVVTCAGSFRSKAAGGPVCPGPNLCKNDLLVQGMPAVFEASDKSVGPPQAAPALEADKPAAGVAR